MKLAIPFIGLLLMSTGAWAQGRGPYAETAEYLSEKYGESVFARGTTGDALIEFWANPETGSWSIIGRPKPDTACPLSSGENLTVAKPTVRGTDS